MVPDKTLAISMQDLKIFYIEILSNIVQISLTWSQLILEMSNKVIKKFHFASRKYKEQNI